MLVNYIIKTSALSFGEITQSKDKNIHLPKSCVLFDRTREQEAVLADGWHLCGWRLVGESHQVGVWQAGDSPKLRYDLYGSRAVCIRCRAWEDSLYRGFEA